MLVLMFQYVGDALLLDNLAMPTPFVPSLIKCDPLSKHSRCTMYVGMLDSSDSLAGGGVRHTRLPGAVGRSSAQHYVHVRAHSSNLYQAELYGDNAV
jgi:hypothetical protein